MSVDRRTIVTIALSGIAAAVGFFALAWPHYREATETAGRIQVVTQRVYNQERELESLEKLARELHAAEQELAAATRTIPDSTDMAGLITALTVPADGVHVLDQTFTRGKIRQVSTVEDGSLYALPLVVDMEASFDVVFDLVKRVEQIDNLVRVAGLRIERRDESRPHIVHATITLEAIFEVDVPAAEEGGTLP